ncbi:MAG: tetratricopeptide repeat protein [Prevotellaceae bacterium]|jgi:tetratricopeptide (TPR) repeat protein|nr:tetratricopeptide repeat protein [Prevotellaceae bacterium]
MNQLQSIKDRIDEGEIGEAITRLNTYISTEPSHHDEAFYLLGNAYRKQGDWQQALNNYSRAIDLNPDSPAREARRMVMDILNYYNKELYNP